MPYVTFMKSFFVVAFIIFNWISASKLQSRKSIGFPFFICVCGVCFDFSISSHRCPFKNVDDSANHRWRMYSFFQSFYKPLHSPPLLRWLSAAMQHDNASPPWVFFSKLCDKKMIRNSKIVIYILLIWTTIANFI